MWGSVGNVFGGAAASSAGSSIPWKGVALGPGDKYSPSHKLLGNFFTIQDEYEDKRQVEQQARLNALTAQSQLDLERASFSQKMQMAREQGLHPLTVLGVPMSSAPMVGAASHEYQASPGSGVSLGDVGRHEPAPLSDAEKRMMEYNERIASANARDAEATAARNELQLMRDSSVSVGRPGSVSNDVQVLRQSALSGVPASRIKFGGGSHGTSDTALISIEPDKVTASSPDNPGLTAGVKPSLMRVIGDDGRSFKVADPSVLQTEIDDGALYNSLVNHGVSPAAAMDFVAYKDMALTALGVLGAGAGLAFKRYRDISAARKGARLNQHRRWKGGE